MEDFDLVMGEAKNHLTKGDLKTLKNDLYDSMNTVRIMRAARLYRESVATLAKASSSSKNDAELSVETAHHKLIEEIVYWSSWGHHA